MLKRDTRAKFVRVGIFSAKYRFWAPSGFWGQTLSAPKYSELVVQQMMKPVALLRRDSPQRQWWVFQNNFYWDDEGLSPMEVEALLLEREQKRRRRIERAMSVTQQRKGQGADSSRRQAIPDDVKMFVWQRDKGRCVKCGSQRNLEFDHIIPISMGGSNTARNIQLLCETCNSSKGASLG